MYYFQEMFLRKLPVYNKYSTSMPDKKLDKFNMDITDFCKKNGNRKHNRDFKSEPVQDDKPALEKEKS